MAGGYRTGAGVGGACLSHGKKGGSITHTVNIQWEVLNNSLSQIEKMKVEHEGIVQQMKSTAARREVRAPDTPIGSTLSL